MQSDAAESEHADAHAQTPRGACRRRAALQRADHRGRRLRDAAAKAPDALASFAPELTYYVTGLSKSLGAGLRVAYLHAPTPRQTQRLAGALRATTVMASPFTVTLATQWIADGTALEMLNAIRNESSARQAIASRVLDAWPYDAHPDGFHLWLPVPARKRLECFGTRAAIANQGIAAVRRGAFRPTAIRLTRMRVCLGGSKTRTNAKRHCASWPTHSNIRIICIRQ